MKSLKRCLPISAPITKCQINGHDLLSSQGKYRHPTCIDWTKSNCSIFKAPGIRVLMGISISSLYYEFHFLIYFKTMVFGEHLWPEICALESFACIVFLIKEYKSAKVCKEAECRRVPSCVISNPFSYLKFRYLYSRFAFYSSVY